MNKLFYSPSPNRKLRAWLIAALSIACCAIASGTLQPANARLAPSPTSPDGTYQVVHGWPRLPEGIMLGQVSGVDVDSHNHVFVFRRAEKLWLGADFSPQPIASPVVMMFDGATGELLASWGEGLFVMPHGLTIERQDNIWLTDVGLHQVFKFDHSGRLLLTVGERGRSGQSATRFNRPTDVAVAGDGSFYVSDGYINSRVVKFSPEGRYLFEWGRKGSGPGQFDVPHSIALDLSGRVYVADRGNARIQIFDSNGTYLSEIKGAEYGRPWAVRLSPDNHLYIVDGGDQPERFPDRARVLKADLTGRIVDAFGRYGNYDGQFVWAHCVAIGADGAVYVGDVSTGMRAQKFVTP
jgi:peptidylamidoglycolate lyase